MSKRTRCRNCGHTPGAWDPNERKQGDQPLKACPHSCACHDEAPIHAKYGPTPPTRPIWPRGAAPGKGLIMPLVIRTYPVHPQANDFWHPADKGCGNEANPFIPYQQALAARRAP